MIRAAMILGAIATAMPGAPQVTGRKPVESDIAYASASPKQTLDLYVPAASGFTTIVYTYGGGWHAGSGKSSAPIAEKLQSLGYGVALVSHRLAPPDTFPAHAEDLAAAFAWVKKNIASRGGDPGRVILAGHSSGAHLSLILATDPRYLAPHGLSPRDVLAVIGVSTPVDLLPHPDHISFGDALLGGAGADAFKRDLELMKDASPTQHVTAGLPPTILLVGEQDFPKLDVDAKAFAAKAEAAGRHVPVHVIPNKSHMAMAAGLTDEHDPVLMRVLEFLKTIR